MMLKWEYRVFQNKGSSRTTLPTTNPTLKLFQMDVLPLTLTLHGLPALHYYPHLFVIAYVHA